MAGSRSAIRNVVIAVVSVAVVLPPLLSGPAGAAEPVITPVDGTFSLEGRGFGHGRGMSQWGAQGAALSGVKFPQILSTYYPGTNLVDGPVDQVLRVHITADTDRIMKVRPAEGLRVRSADNSRMLPRKIDGATVTMWRTRKIETGLRVAGRVDGKWRKLSVDGRRTLASPVAFRTEPSRGVRIAISPVEERDYRGQALAFADSRTGGVLRVVNKVKMEDYLRSVVPSESFPTWEPDALRAQSVAARTYALWRTKNVPLGFADICDTTACQVYHGIRRLSGSGAVTKVWEAASTDAAIEATAGRSLQYLGVPALTEFSASNGGFSTDGLKPYLIARLDPWDGVVRNNANSWTMELKGSTIAARLRANGLGDVGKVTGLRVLQRDGNGRWGGRVLRVRVIGKKNTVDVNGFRFASIVSLRHSWWRSQDGLNLDPLPSASTENFSDDDPSAPAPMVEQVPPVGPTGSGDPVPVDPAAPAPPAQSQGQSPTEPQPAPTAPAPAEISPAESSPTQPPAESSVEPPPPPVDPSPAP
ncbi:MAG: SpoIID/LytB domain-containing protein [Sporichthyaceae bacterium]